MPPPISPRLLVAQSTNHLSQLLNENPDIVHQGSVQVVIQNRMYHIEPASAIRPSTEIEIQAALLRTCMASDWRPGSDAEAKTLNTFVFKPAQQGAPADTRPAPPTAPLFAAIGTEASPPKSPNRLRAFLGQKKTNWEAGNPFVPTEASAGPLAPKPQQSPLFRRKSTPEDTDIPAPKPLTSNIARKLFGFAQKQPKAPVRPLEISDPIPNRVVPARINVRAPETITSGIKPTATPPPVPPKPSFQARGPQPPPPRNLDAKPKIPQKPVVPSRANATPPPKPSRQIFMNYDALRLATRSINTIDVWDARFKDILLPETTAVRLPLNPRQAGTMTPGIIHASHIRSYPSQECRPILTQYPKTGAEGDLRSVENFWRMALQEKCDLILDLTKPSERDKLGIPYYPEEGESKIYGSIRVTCTGYDNNQLRYRVTNGTTGEMNFISRHHYQNWFDHQTIPSDGLLKMAQAINGKTVPIIHCHAGVGRSGTVTVAAAMLKYHRQGILTPDSNVRLLTETVLNLREDRGASAVQTKEQWESLQEFTLMLLKYRSSIL